MPFTPSHAVIALPFVRTPLVPSAIAIGAMAPDLPLFLRGTPLSYHLTHTNHLVGVLVAAALVVIWWMLLRPAVRELLPVRIAQALGPDWDSTGFGVIQSVRAGRSGSAGLPAMSTFALCLAVSLMLGVFSHTVWDAFTHEGRWGVGMVPALDQQWGPLLGYKWLQYGSSVGGLAILAIVAILWWRAHVTNRHLVVRVLPNAVRVVWWISLPLALVVVAGLGLAAFGPFTAEFTPAHLAYRLFPPTVGAWAIATFALAVVVQVRRKRR